MGDIATFKNPKFGSIRTTEINGNPWFVGKDIASVLGYERATKAIRDHVDEEDIDEIPIQDSIGRMQNTPVVNESGLYSLILSSKLASAKAFKHWVTSEVLPSIRKNGGYINGQETMSDEELLSKALMVAQNKIAEKDKQIEYQQKVIESNKPKVLFADAVSASDTSILIRDLAKLICQNGYEIGERRLFEWLRRNGYLIRRVGSDSNMPTQRSMEMGLFEIKESTSVNSNGSIRINKTPKVTGKGQQYFIQKFLKKGDAK